MKPESRTGEPRGRVGLVLVVLFAIVTVLSACGGGDDKGDAESSGESSAADEDANAETSVPDDADDTDNTTETSASDAGGEGEEDGPTGDQTFDEHLPKTVQYGDAELTVTSARVSATPPSDVTVSGDAPAYAVLEVELTSLLPADAYFTLPHAGNLHLEIGDEVVTAASTDSLDSRETDAVPVVFPLDDGGVDLGAATFRIQELAGDPVEERRPADLPIGDGDVSEPITPEDLTAAPGSIDQSTLGSTARLEVVSADLSEDLGLQESGEPWPADDRGLGRARDGMLFLRVQYQGRSMDDVRDCTNSFTVGTYAVDGEASEDGRTIGGTPSTEVMCGTTGPETVVVVVEVPDDEDSWALVYFDDYYGDPAGTITFSR